MRNPNEPSIAGDEAEKRELVRRIGETPAFRQAPRIREFLLFVADRALSGRVEEITEQQIGHEVFHRSEAYDTSNDNIVRVSARQLRTKLKEYADAEGAAEKWTLEIPKGAYVPVFTARAPKEAANASRDPARFWKLAALAFAALALALGVAQLRSREAAVPSGVRRAAAPLTDLVIRPGQRTLIVLADSSLVLLHELTGQIMDAEEYASRQYSGELLRGFSGPRLERLARSIAAQQLTSIADVGFAIRLLQLRPDAADRLMVVHARNVGPRNLKDGNAILIGGPRSNPWAGLLEDRLSFRFEFSGERPWARIVNPRPQSGEPAAYETEGSNGVATRAFARLALVPNLNHTGRVLLISGTTIEATEAATESFLDDRAGEMLTGVLGRNPAQGDGFEVLLETRAIGGTARNSRIIAHRLLP